MSISIAVGGRRIGDGHPCFVIAEAGVNHDGNPDLAHALIDAAGRAGADAVKFQTWITEELVTPDAGIADYQKSGSTARTQYELLKSLELDADVFASLKAHAEAIGLVFISTPDDVPSVDLLDRLDVTAFKIGSAEVTATPFLDYVARKGRPLIMSTGLSTLDEVAGAVTAVRQAGARDLALLHCVSSYPADPSTANLRAMDTVRREFACPVGFSDHTMGIVLAPAAVALGACIIEKHLTLDRSRPGPDHPASLSPAEFLRMVKAIRLVESALGSGVKSPTPAELVIRPLVRKVVVAKRSMPAGHLVLAADVEYRRAGEGILPGQVHLVLGRRLGRDVAQFERITPRDLA